MTDKNRRARILREIEANHHTAVAYLKAHPDHLWRHTETVVAMDTCSEAELFAALKAEYECIQAAGVAKVDFMSRVDAILHHLLVKFHKLDEVLAQYHDDPSFCEYVRDAAEYQALVEEIIQNEQMEKN